jgi:cellulose synthase/poly-beta-1,6-N-acetylglucosamine synthase-like glycosyltransferase
VNISRGRNLAIQAARADLLAVTDAGVRLPADWLARLLAAFDRAHPPDVAMGFFRADPATTFELALGATTLPDASEIHPERFLPSSRSVAFTREVWRRAGGYPEWLDYCEDLIFDLNLRAAGARFAWVPEAVVAFRPRPTLHAFALQYFRYARGDGKADLWRRRHAARYATYLGTPLLVARLPRHLWLPLLLLGTAVYLRRPYQRLLARRRQTTPLQFLQAAALVPLLRLAGDLAKMAGYPVGLAWRLRHRPPAWRITPPPCPGAPARQRGAPS